MRRQAYQTQGRLARRLTVRHLLAVRYEGQIYRPPSEADAYILQATIGCSWNACVYCDMYRDKRFRVRELPETLADLAEARQRFGAEVRKVFVADGDALILTLDQWLPLLEAARASFPRLERVSCYAMARNVLEKSPAELAALRAAGLKRLYIGPESGDDLTLKKIAKGSTFDEHVRAAERAHQAGLELSMIVMLGVAGVARSEEHAAGTAALVSAMNPEYLAALTTTVIPGTPLSQLVARDKFELPSMEQMFGELRVIVAESRPTSCVFRTNHASNYLPLAGDLPRDRERIVATIDAALAGRIALRPESSRRL
ncbi:MAG: Oxygen-independent coproporphyrinogen oxidase, Fe-S oxidoreductase [Myxococcaceae bacterium]|nr:Oxygen-independent coproporphyrinogen oxidase, Fe-S oxidoreductase [Myxococcaceae bacterium]